MTVTVASLWDPKWMEAERTERRIWKQTIQAYDVDHWIMAPGRPGQFTSPQQFETVDEMMDFFRPPRTFLIAPKTMKGKPLENYKHPEHAIYVLGNTADNMVRFIRPGDHVVSIYTPTESAMFGHAVLGTVLYDRARKI